MKRVLLLAQISIIIFYGCESQKNDEVQTQVNSISPAEQVLQQQQIPSADNSRVTAITAAVSEVSPAVVSVSVTKIEKRVRRSPFSGDPFFQQFFPEIYRDRVYHEELESIGSGFIISADGFIVTNDHVAGKGVEFTINMSNGNQYPARLIGTDFISDISLLKIDEHTFRPAKLGVSNDLMKIGRASCRERV